MAGFDPYRRTVPFTPSARLSSVIAAVAVAAAATSFTLAAPGDGVGVEIGEPLVIGALAALVTLSYVLCGLFAWRWRPESRFGPLMIAAGFVHFASTLVWSTSDV